MMNANITKIKENDELLEGLLPQIISRQEWGAVASRRRKKLKTPINKIIFTRARVVNCYSKAHCMHNIRKHQEELIEKSRADIPHNFIVDRYGRVYEVMGWDYQADYNFSWWLPWEREQKALYETSITVAMIGCKDNKPSIPQVRAALGLLIVGIQNDILLENVDIIENDICGPIIPSEELLSKGEIQQDPTKEDQMTEDEILRLLNNMDRKKPPMTKEEFREQVEDSERIFKEFDEQLKIDNQKYIEENYPWAFKTTSTAKNQTNRTYTHHDLEHDW